MLMPPSDLALAQACAAAYATRAVYTASEIDGVLVLAGRGTEFAEDWVKDADFIPVNVTGLGDIPRGFYGDALGSFAEVRALVTDAEAYAVTGHSLGGAWAQVTVGLLITAGLPPPLVLTTFGCPNVGKLNGVISSTPGTDDWNGDDPIPGAPLFFSKPRYANLRYYGQPTANPIDSHFIAAYRGSLAALGLGAAA